jgi:hypothetical protein
MKESVIPKHLKTLRDKLTMTPVINKKEDEHCHRDNRCYCPSTDRGRHKLMNKTGQGVGIQDQTKVSRQQQ